MNGDDKQRTEDLQRLGGAAFRAGWAAACLTIADLVQHKETARRLREECHAPHHSCSRR